MTNLFYHALIMSKKVELTNNEIIDMFIESGMKEEEIRDAMRQLKDRFPETILEYLKKIKEKAEAERTAKEEERLKAEEKHKQMIKQQTEYKETQLKRIKEKIKAAQDENKKKEAEFDAETQKGYEDIDVHGYFKVRIFLESGITEFYGFEKNATANTLYQRVQTDLGIQNCELSIFSTTTIIQHDSTPLENIFNFPAVMLSLSTKETIKNLNHKRMILKSTPIKEKSE